MTTMRARLIAKLVEIVPSHIGTADDDQALDNANAAAIVDAILAELRTFKPEKDTVFLRFVTGDGTEDNYYADEIDVETFTAMIDAIRGEQG